jgi:FkbM family methyltransferase
MFKDTVKTLIPAKYQNRLAEIKSFYVGGGFSTVSYSQEGEDLVLKRIFENRTDGFYVDVGAHHPMRYSNTYIFYNKGWRGINIDAMPGSMELFRKIRPRDVNLEVPISDTRGVSTYYAFNEPALNGFSKELSDCRNVSEKYRIIFQKDIETRTLAEILDAHLPKDQRIDFLSIDVEGLDFQVLQSNNWEKYKPVIVLVEIRGASLEEIIGSAITGFMKARGYAVFAKTFNTVFFRISK